MEEQTPIKERQKEHWQHLQAFINRSDEEIIEAGYKGIVLDRERNFLFDSDQKDGREDYQRALLAFRQQPGLLVGEAVFNETDQESQIIWEKIAYAVQMPEERIKETEDLDFEIPDYLEERNEPVVIFLKNIHHLPLSLQGQIRGFQQDLFGRISIRLFALASERALGEEKWLTSPLANIFSGPENVAALSFDPQRGRETITAYRQAVAKLATADSARVVLPSRTGKSTFARLLRDIKYRDVMLVDLERFLREEGKTVDLENLPQSRDGQVVLLDEAQILTAEQREALVKCYGKVVFIENANLLQGE